MNKNTNIRFIIFIVGVIVLGFFITSILNFITSNNIIREDAENITKLTAMTIFAEIQNELTKPIFVGLTMANDSFVKSWLAEEDNQDQEAITRYLKEIQVKYGYSSAFLVSGNSGNYYNTEGILKKISTEDSHDVWFYEFVKSGKDYALDVDTDQANEDTLSIFINCKIMNVGDRNASVIGVGLEMREIQNILAYYDELLQLDILLIDTKGLVQVATDDTAIENNNYFSQLDNPDMKARILGNKEDFEVLRPEGSINNNYVFTKFINDLDWYIVVKNNPEALYSALYRQQLVNLAIVIAVVLMVVCIAVILTRRYQHRIMQLATTDVLTGLFNRRSMGEDLNQMLAEADKTGKPLCLFLFDIDDFKKMNDTHGHLAGDEVLARTATVAREYMKKSTIYRLGGDEFAGMIDQDIAAAEVMLEGLRKRIEKDEELSVYHLTVSIGVSEYVAGQSQDQLIYRADQAMYRAKEIGKNKVVS
jgi:diguanylate cyclase (GGDEF)-like protein